MPPNRLGGSSVLGLFLCLCLIESAPSQSTGLVEIDLLDSKSGQPLDCRVQLRSSSGVVLKPLSSRSVRGWSVVNGLLRFRGRPGDYRYEISAGPEFARVSGGFTLDKNALTEDVLELQRHADMAAEGWFAGDLLSYLAPQQTEAWMKAEGVFAVSSASHSAQSDTDEPEDAAADGAGGVFRGFLDDRPSGGLLFHHWLPQAAVPETLPSSRLIALSRNSLDSQQSVHIEIQRLWARDLPVWLASGRVDSVQLLSDHLTFDGKGGSQVKPLVLPEGQFQGGSASGRMVEQIYWNMLEAGLRIPPSAGSGFGKRSSPLGYNRVYALISRPDWDLWWRALREGNTMVTNGPLLRATINGMPPGHLFSSGEPIELDVNLVLTSADPVEYVEIIFNGASLYRAALDEFARQGGRIPVLTINDSGWLVIRVVAKNEQTYRMATTAPFSFELAGKKRISRTAVEYFQHWLSKATEEIEKLSADEVAAHQPFLRAAEQFWSRQGELSTVP